MDKMVNALADDIENLEDKLGELKMYLAYTTDLSPCFLNDQISKIEMQFDIMMDTLNEVYCESRKEII